MSCCSQTRMPPCIYYALFLVLCRFNIYITAIPLLHERWVLFLSYVRDERYSYSSPKWEMSGIPLPHERRALFLSWVRDDCDPFPEWELSVILSWVRVESCSFREWKMKCIEWELSCLNVGLSPQSSLLRVSFVCWRLCVTSMSHMLFLSNVVFYTLGDILPLVIFYLCLCSSSLLYLIYILVYCALCPFSVIAVFIVDIICISVCYCEILLERLYSLLMCGS